MPTKKSMFLVHMDENIISTYSKFDTLEKNVFTAGGVALILCVLIITIVYAFTRNNFEDYIHVALLVFGLLVSIYIFILNFISFRKSICISPYIYYISKDMMQGQQSEASSRTIP